jgi:hypothetical protein
MTYAIGTEIGAQLLVTSRPMPRPACGPRGFIIQLMIVLINANNLSSTEAVFWQNKAKMHNDFNEPDLSNEAHTCRRR